MTHLRLQVNDAWASDAGVLVKKSDEMVQFTNCHWGFNQYCEHAATMVRKNLVLFVDHFSRIPQPRATPHAPCGMDLRGTHAHWMRIGACNPMACTYIHGVQVWKKQLDDTRVAVLLMNNQNVTADVTITWKADLPPDLNFRCPAGGCAVRDIYTHADLGFYGDSFTAKDLAPHDSAFIIVKQCFKEPTYPFVCVAASSGLTA